MRWILCDGFVDVSERNETERSLSRLAGAPKCKILLFYMLPRFINMDHCRSLWSPVCAGVNVCASRTRVDKDKTYTEL